MEHPLHIYDEEIEFLYLGNRPKDSYEMHKAFSNAPDGTSYDFKFPDLYEQGGKFQYDEVLSKYLNFDLERES